MTGTSAKIMIVAGEASGDRHAAKLVAALRSARPDVDLEFFGSAGPLMREAGVDAVVESDGLSIVGLAEIASALPMFLKAFNSLKRAAVSRKPDVVVLVDFPEFNLKLARSLKKKGFKVVYYISPQIWAWRKYRISTIRKYVDLVLTILPFEKGWYLDHGVENVEYVGSPLAREVHPERTKQQFCRDHSLDISRPIVSLLPGSRHKEIVRILPVLLEAASKMAAVDPSLQFVIAMASERHLADLETAKARSLDFGFRLPEKLLVVVNETYDALNASDAAAVTSGTATLEAGIIGTPLAIVYKTSKLNYSLLEPLISVEHYGLINLIGGERIAAELIQHEFTPATLADELFRLLKPEVNASMREKLRVAADSLGHGGASGRAAEAILRIIDLR